VGRRLIADVVALRQPELETVDAETLLGGTCSNREQTAAERECRTEEPLGSECTS
jgi:hypothetical protein